MTQASSGKQQSTFSQWLRTGRLPSVRASEEVELKFNPWHDPADGRFTFAGSGRHYGAGQGKPSYRADRTPDRANPQEPRIATGPKVDLPRSAQPVRSVEKPAGGGATGVQPKHPVSKLERRPNPAAEFVGGVGEGLYDVAEGTAAAAYSALTTNPVTTVHNVGRGIAGMIETAISAEEKIHRPVFRSRAQLTRPPTPPRATSAVRPDRSSAMLR